MDVKAISSIGLGNFIEWYDAGLFGVFAPLFALLFFPTYDHRAAIFGVFTVFAIGFLARPLGAIVFGHFGDKIGRVKTLQGSISVISLSTIAMAFLPTYAQVGIYAPMLLVLLRFFQGLSTGGEYTGIVIYLTEIAPKKKRALFTAFAAMSSSLGILSAATIAFIAQKTLSLSQYQMIGWRLAFLFGACVSFWIAYSRWSLLETDDFKLVVKEKKIAAVPLLKAFRKTPWGIVRTFCLVAFGSTLYYISFIYLQSYLVDTIHLSLLTALEIKIACFTCMLGLVLVGGLLCDRLGRRLTFLLITASLVLCAWPCFYLLNTNVLTNTIFATAIFTLISSLEQGSTPATIVEQFPPSLRYSGVSFSYNLAQAVCGGTAPMIAAFLVTYTHNPMAPAYYLFCIAAITFIVVLFSLAETAPRYKVTAKR